MKEQRMAKRFFGKIVSIPYRFNERVHSIVHIYAQYDVSIPYRFNERTAAASDFTNVNAFQFLIGSMKACQNRDQAG